MDLVHGTIPVSSSGLNSAFVSRRFKFSGCRVETSGLFSNALWSRGHSTLSIRLLMELKLIAWLGLCVITSGIISCLGRSRMVELFLSFAFLMAWSINFCG